MTVSSNACHATGEPTLSAVNRKEDMYHLCPWVQQPTQPDNHDRRTNVASLTSLMTGARLGRHANPNVS